MIKLYVDNGYNIGIVVQLPIDERESTNVVLTLVCVRTYFLLSN